MPPPLAAAPVVERLDLGSIDAVPEWHPEHGTFTPFPVGAWVVRHPDGPVVVDTGVGVGNPLIDEWYRPRVVPLVDALAALGIDERDVVAVVLSHLHFDHCGQHASLAAPVHVQAREHAAAQAEAYTVPEWAAIPDHRLRLVDGDAEIADGLHLLATPGHTPGHQSVLVEAGGERTLLAAQCAFRAAELRGGVPSPANLHDPAWEAEARRSLDRVHALAPVTCHLSHDPEVVVLPR